MIHTQARQTSLFIGSAFPCKGGEKDEVHIDKY